MTRIALAVLVLAAGVVGASGIAPHARADDATATTTVDTPPAITPTPTAVVPSPDVPPTSPPAVTRERGTPVATQYVQAPVATEALPTATAVHDVLPTVLVVPTPTPDPTAPSGGGSATVYVPLPSPAQLRENARLRWGSGVPASVRRWAFLIVPAARRYGLQPNLIAAVMTMESNGDPLALSGADARGLMQILHGPWDPKQNVNIGARMLAELHARFGRWKLALAAYNAGPNAVAAYGGIPPYRETRDYVIVVTYLWDLFSGQRLAPGRKAQYRSTLHDLSRFKSQRKKLKLLARAGQVAPDTTFSCAGLACDLLNRPPKPAPLDPFWPVAGLPDPLVRVDPVGQGG